jgi:predicted DCC family thiol-disulfide oxidoreductase YuxK
VAAPSVGTRTATRLRGVLFYDRDCRWCRRFIRLGRASLARHGFAVAALQSPWAQRRLALDGVPDEMKLLLPHGQVLGGARALVVIAAALPWARPLAVGARVGPLMAALDASYRFVAAHRGCSASACALHTRA